MQDKGARRGVWMFDNIFQEDQGVALFAALKKGAGQADFHRQAVGRLRQAFAKLLLRLLAVAAAQKRVGEVQPQRVVVGRGAQGFAQRLNGFVTGKGLFAHKISPRP